MASAEETRKGGIMTLVLPPLLTQHVLPAGLETNRRPAARMEGSCNNSTPRTLNNCFYRARGPLAPE
jgi:hypothetical protein